MPPNCKRVDEYRNIEPNFTSKLPRRHYAKKVIYAIFIKMDLEQLIDWLRCCVAVLGYDDLK